MFRKALKLILCLALPLIVGGLAAYFVKENISNWYDLISKPSFDPPEYIYAPVWIALYVLMGVSLFMIWITPTNTHKRIAFFIWLLQLFLNFGWSILFFYYKDIALSIAEISMLLLSIVVMIFVFFRINRVAALLQLPYLVWVFFTTILTMVIWELN
jgi:benzodiazapine receptor